MKCKDRRLLLSLVFFMVSILIAKFLPEIFCIRENRLYEFLSIKTHGYQGRQIILVIIMFLSGVSFTLAVSDLRWNIWEIWLHVFPIAVLQWIILSMVCLVLGIPYTLCSMIILEVIWNGLFLAVVSFKKDKLRSTHIKGILEKALLLLGILNIISTGCIFTWVDSDGYYFITMMGKTLASTYSIIRDMSFYLTHTIIGASTLSSLSYMVHLDNYYILHHALMIDVIGLIAVRLNKKSSDKKGIWLWIIFMITSPMLLYMIGQIINNSYVMVYLIILVMDLQGSIETRNFSKGNILFIPFLCTGVMLLRPDAALTMCCIMFALGETDISKRHMITLFLIPCFITWLTWYVKVYLILGKLNGSLVKGSTIIGMAIAFVFVWSYFAFIRERVKHTQTGFRKIVCFGTMAVFLITFIWKPTESYSMIMTYLYNFSNFSDPQIFGAYVYGGFWGISVFNICILLYYTHIVLHKKFSTIEFIFVLLCIMTYFLGFFRGVLANSYPRGGFGDSFNRALISYTPILLFGIFLQLNSCNSRLKESRTEN